MSGPLDGAEAKLWRANEHLRGLDQKWITFLTSEADPVRVRKKLYASKGYYRVWVEEMLPLPPLFSVIIGDFVHNLRSTLNYLAWELAKHDIGGRPCETTAFPIVKDRDEYRDSARCSMLADISTAHRDLIESFQGHERGDGENNPLRWLSGLDNRDKHRTLHTMYSAPASWAPARPIAVQDCSIGEITWFTDKALVMKGELMRAEVIVCGPKPKVKMEGQLLPDIAVDESGAGAEALLGVGGFVRIIFRSIEEIVEPRPYGTLKHKWRRLPGFNRWPPLA